MTPLAALCGDERLLDAWRREGFAGAVHSVFDRVVNLVDASGHLASLAVRSLDSAPNTLLVDAASFGRPALRSGMSARARDAVLTIDEARFAVCFEHAAPWRAQLPDYPDDDAQLLANLAAVRAQPQGDCPDVLEPLARAICDALRHDDVDRARAQGRALLGLGPGLTPSGDDFLVGLFAVLNLANSPCHGLRRACDGILAVAHARTNAISIAALREAARGRVRDSIQALLRELVGGRPPQLYRALARVLAIGATSGRDMVAGIVCGLDANVRHSSASLLTAIQSSVPYPGPTTWRRARRASPFNHSSGSRGPDWHLAASPSLCMRRTAFRPLARKSRED